MAGGEDTFNIPEDRTSYLPLNLAAHSHNSATTTATKSANLSALQKPADGLQDAAQTDADFERRHKSLKDAAWHWATENFPPTTGPKDATKISDLPRLVHEHPELAEYVNFIASCPDNETWEEFLSSRKTFLAFGVLGKALEVHIFGQEMFGASEAQVKVLRLLDLEMMHQDSK